VAAHQQQDEGIVVICYRSDVRGGLPLELAAGAGLLAAQQVGQLAAGHPDEPGPRVVRDAFGGPLRGGGDQRLLGGVLGGVEVAVAANHRAEDLRRQLAEQVLGLGAPVHLQV
jgi:hypothetical protein